MLFQKMQVYLLLTQILKKAHKFYCREFISIALRCLVNGEQSKET